MSCKTGKETYSLSPNCVLYYAMHPRATQGCKVWCCILDISKKKWNKFGYQGDKH